MPKFDFYPSFNAGEVSPLIDARTSLEKYRSACRTLENFQILPYGGVIRRPGTQYLGATKSATSQTRLIGFNFSTSTRFIIEMGVGYMRFWNPATGALQTNTSGGTLEISHPYAGADLREIQYVQINDIMFFAHANYPPYKLSRLADNNWTFAPVVFDYPPLFEQNTTDTTIRVSGELGYTILTASAPIFDDSMNGGQWALEWKRPLATVSVNIEGNYLSDLMDVAGDWTFTTFGTWDATVQILRYPNDKMEKGYTQTGTLTRSGAVATVNHTAHGYNTGDLLAINAGGTAPFHTGRTSLATITVISENQYTYPVANSGATTVSSAFVENISQMEVVKEYDRATGESNIITSGTESARCGLMIRVLNYTSNTKGRAVIESSDFRTGGLVTIADTYMDSWAATTAYVVGDYVTQGGSTYKCISPHTSTATFDATKWTVQPGVTSGTKAGANVTRWLSASARANAKTIFWSEAAFSAKRGYPRSVAMHEQRLCFGGTSSQPNTIWCSAIDDFENFQTGTTAADAVQFTLAASEGNRINWMYSQSQLLIGTSGDEWTIGSADSTQALSATNVQANRQSSYGSKYMRAALVNDVLLFVQRNGRKVRELVYELNKDGWVAPDLTLLAEHITSGEIVDIAYQQQPDAVLWCVRGDGTLIAMTYERDQKVVGWHRHTLGDADVESVATIYGNGTEDELWMVVKRYVGIVAGQRVQFTNLPAGSNISSTETYVVLENPSGNTFTIGSLIGESLGIANSSITPTTTRVVVVDGSYSAPVSNLTDGVFTYTGDAAATKRTVERFPLLWRKHIDDQTAKDYRYLDGHVSFATGAVNRSISGLAHLEGKTVTVMQEGNAPVTRTVNNGAITVPQAAAGYLGQPYTSTLRPMKLDADFEDGTAQSRKKRIHQVVVRTLKSRGGEVRTNNGTWYALAPTTTTGDQKIILGGAFGTDADVDVRQTEPYPMCIISILPKWDAYGNE
jgi:hypothetical protein